MTARAYDTAVRRWQGVGPYYAMFPTSFADSVVAKYTNRGDIVFDPFAGRGTAIFSAAHQDRVGIGIEINSVGWVYGKTKLRPADLAEVAARFCELGTLAPACHSAADTLPTFFHHCFSRRTREFLIAARENLKWRSSRIDRTAMALLLVYLHGKSGAALSNQMRQTKAMAPDYAVRWWCERDLAPPDLDPVEFMLSRLGWRYAKGYPNHVDSDMHLEDSERHIRQVQTSLASRGRTVRLLFTSPPYFARTNYHYDQWLRLWLLGGPPNARRVVGSNDIRGKFENSVRYRTLLKNVFGHASELMSSDSIIYVRTGLGKVTFDATLEALQTVFPTHRLDTTLRPYSRPTQTKLFGDSGIKPGEVDIVMTIQGSGI